MQERKVRKERTPRSFILVHSNLSYIQFVKATLAWLCTISNFYKVSTLTLPKYAKTPQKTIESHKNHTSTTRTLLQTWKTTRHTHKAWERSNLSGSTTLPTTNHFLQASNQAKSSKNWSKINLQQLQHLWSRRREFPHVSRTKSCSKNDQQTSLSKIIAFIVKLLRNSTGWFSNQSVDFTWLKWNQSIKN